MFCFYSFGNNPGGVQSIQINLISYLVTTGIKIKLFDSKDGWVRQSLIKLNVDFEDHIIEKRFDKTDYSHLVTADDFFVVFTGHFFECLLLFSHSNCKMIFWEVYYPWIDKFIPSRRIPLRIMAKKIEISILKILLENNGIVFIDKMGVEAVERRLNVKIKNKFLPIPVIVPEINAYSTRKFKQNDLNISYIGRAVDWKIYPILKFLKDLREYNISDNIKIHLITDDNDKLLQFLKDEVNPKSEIFYYNNLSSQEIEDVLLKSDLHIGMGTSALDGAKLGIPTILIDACNNEFPDNYLYRWIYETAEFSLGEFITNDNFIPKNKHTVSAVVSSVIQNHDEISKKCYNYVKDNYNVNLIAANLIAIQNESTLKVSHFKSLFIIKYYKLLRFLSIN